MAGMFETGSDEHTYPQVNQVLTRMEASRESNELVTGADTTLSAPTTPSLERKASGFFGIINRPKNAIPPKKDGQEPTTPTTTESNDKPKPSSLRIPWAAAISTKKSISTFSLKSKASRSFLSPIMGRSPVERIAPGWGDSPNRSSKESELSQTTNLTSPVSESQSNEPEIESWHNKPNPFHALDEAPYITNVIEKTYRIGNRNTVLAAPRTGPETAGFELSQTPTSPPFSTSRAASGATKSTSTSKFIDTWHTALHTPDQNPPQVDRDGTVRRGKVLMPPNSRRRQQRADSATRQLAQPTIPIHPLASPIKFEVDDFNAWKTLAEWAAVDAAAQGESNPASEGKESRKQAEEAASRSIINDMELHYSRGGISKTTTTSAGNEGAGPCEEIENEARGDSNITILNEDGEPMDESTQGRTQSTRFIHRAGRL